MWSVKGDLANVGDHILAGRQVLRRFGREDRVECRYDKYEGDIRRIALLQRRCLLLCAEWAMGM